VAVGLQLAASGVHSDRVAATEQAHGYLQALGHPTQVNTVWCISIAIMAPLGAGERAAALCPLRTDREKALMRCLCQTAPVAVSSTGGVHFSITSRVHVPSQRFVTHPDHSCQVHSISQPNCCCIAETGLTIAENKQIKKHVVLQRRGLAPLLHGHSQRGRARHDNAPFWWPLVCHLVDPAYAYAPRWRFPPDTWQYNISWYPM
jgi:hypothetical protein